MTVERAVEAVDPPQIALQELQALVDLVDPSVGVLDEDAKDEALAPDLEAELLADGAVALDPRLTNLARARAGGEARREPGKQKGTGQEALGHAGGHSDAPGVDAGPAGAPA
jgi:hypothetical protein